MAYSYGYMWIYYCRQHKNIRSMVMDRKEEDVESCDSRPVWAVDTDGEIEALSFNGLVLCIPFFVITIGSLWRDD